MDADFYNILGVNTNAKDNEIKDAYRQLAFKYHPNRNLNNDAADKFKAINEAYQVLSDKTYRLIYNIFGKQGLKNPIPCIGTRLVEDPPIIVSCYVTLEMIYHGFPMLIMDPTPIFTNIRPGCPEGERLVFPNMGIKKIGHIPADIVVVVHGLNPRPFTRHGNDLHYTANITLCQKMLGQPFCFEAPYGRCSFRIPRNIDNVKVYEGFGLPDYYDLTKRGDLYVTFNMTYPAHVRPQYVAHFSNLSPNFP